METVAPEAPPGHTGGRLGSHGRVLAWDGLMSLSPSWARGMYRGEECRPAGA